MKRNCSIKKSYSIHAAGKTTLHALCQATFFWLSVFLYLKLCFFSHSVAANPHSLTIELTNEERTYLDEISPIDFGGHQDWLPYEAFDEQGNYIGQVADHLSLIAFLLDIQFNIVTSSDWQSSLDLFKRGEIAILSKALGSEPENDTLFTQSYSKTPVVIVMRKSDRFIESLDEIDTTSIALIKDYGNTPSIINAYPNIPFSFVATPNEGLLAVASGKIDALVINSAQATFYMRRLGLDRLQIAGKTKFPMRLSFAVAGDHAPLVQIMNKALDAIYLSQQQKAIYNKWSNVQVIKQTDNTLLKQILLGVAVLLLLGLIWLSSLKKEINARRKIAEELIDAREVALDANRAKTRFLAAMSHELRTPLHGMMGMLELIDGDNLNAEQTSALKTIRSSSEVLLSTLNDILDFSRIDSNKLEIKHSPFRIRATIERAINTYAQLAHEKSLDIRFHAAPELMEPVYGDETRFEQLINNFINNAIKFTHSGSIQIDAECELEADAFMLNFSVKDTGIGISKKNLQKLFDDFLQIDMDTKRAFGGTGLGLSICKKLADLMDGTIHIDSQENIGTTVSYSQRFEKTATNEEPKSEWPKCHAYVQGLPAPVENAIVDYLRYQGIPRTSVDIPNFPNIKNLIEQKTKVLLFTSDTQYKDIDDSDYFTMIEVVDHRDLSINRLMTRSAVLNTNPMQTGYLDLILNTYLKDQKTALTHKHFEYQKEPLGLHLLVAEDHPVNRHLIDVQLDRLGCTSVLAEDGSKAIEFLREDTFDGIITDCHMPNMDGYELAETVRSRFNFDFPIIAMTANALVGEKEKCLASGMNDMLTKPTNLETLANCLKKWFPKKRSRRNREEKTDADSDLSRKLEERFFDKQGAVAMLKSYFQSTEEDIAALEKAISSGQQKEAQQIAHRIKGAAKIVFADDIAAWALKIEKSDDGESNSCMIQLKDAFRHFQDKVNDTIAEY